MFIYAYSKILFHWNHLEFSFGKVCSDSDLFDLKEWNEIYFFVTTFSSLVSKKGFFSITLLGYILQIPVPLSHYFTQFYLCHLIKCLNSTKFSVHGPLISVSNLTYILINVTFTILAPQTISKRLTSMGN